jgi:hypothetical protein
MQGLETELAEMKKDLQTENDEHGLLRAAIGAVCDDLEVAQAEGTSSLVAHVIEIMARVHVLERNALHVDVLRSFAIARSHYGDNIDLDTMSLGYAPSYEDKELEEIETAVAPLRRTCQAE